MENKFLMLIDEEELSFRNAEEVIEYVMDIVYVDVDRKDLDVALKYLHKGESKILRNTCKIIRIV